MSRTYNFELPYNIGSFELTMGLSRLRSEGMMERLPDELQQKIVTASTGWDGVNITQDDLDSIDDDTFALLAKDLSLDYTQDEDS